MNLILDNNKIDSLEGILKYANAKSSFVKRNFNFKENKTAYVAVHRVSVPSFESGALKILSKVFPFLNDKKFLLGTLKPQEVLEFDKSEIDVYARSKKIEVSNIGNLKLVCDHILNSIKNEKVTISLNTVIDTLPKNTSTGFPYYQKKGTPSAVRTCKIQISKVLSLKTFRPMYEYIRKFPVTIFHRFTPKMKLNNKTYDPNFKVRQILATPFFIISLEKLLFYNFVTSFSNSIPSYTNGLKKVQISNLIQKLRMKARRTNKVILCGDIKGNDKSISLTHSSLFFQIASNFVDDNYMEIFKAIMMYHFRTPMLFSEGIKYTHGSTVSGSWLTSTFNTLCVMIAINYSYLSIYGRIPSFEDYLIQGDDFIIILKEEKDGLLFKKYMRELNLRLRLDTAGVVNWYNDIEFLGFFWNTNGLPDQTDEWIISRILYPEKFIRFDGPKRITYRILSIILNLKRYRVLFSEFKKYDDELRYLHLQGSKPSFQLISFANEILNVRIPLKEFWLFGWRML